MSCAIPSQHTGPSCARILATGMVLLAAIASGCADQESPATPPPARTDQGWMVVAAVAFGDDIDADGFVISVDGGSHQSVAAGEAVRFSGLDPALHNVRIDGIAPNCVVHGPNVQSAEVVAHEGTAIVYNVTCVDRSAGAIRARILTPGFDRFSVIVDDEGSFASEDGEIVVGGLEAGNHTIRLHVDPLACRLVGPNPRAEPVAIGRVTEVLFNLTCPPGSLVVTVRTTGTSQPLGYKAWIVQAGDSYCDMGTCRTGHVQSTGSVWFDGLSLSAYHVTLVVPENCTPISGSQVVQLNVEGPAHAPFTVSCR